jgi:hypothetical protein
MTEKPEAQPRTPLAALLHKFRDDLSVQAENCATDQELMEVLSTIGEASTYLSRSLKAAITSRANGGTMPEPSMPAVLLDTMFTSAIDDMPEDQAAVKAAFEQWVRLQRAVLYASGEVLTLLQSRAQR